MDYADKISTARTLLLSKFKSTLSPAIADSLNPQEHGVPFVHLDQDPPQIAAIKKSSTVCIMQSVLLRPGMA